MEKEIIEAIEAAKVAIKKDFEEQVATIKTEMSDEQKKAIEKVETAVKNRMDDLEVEFKKSASKVADKEESFVGAYKKHVTKMLETIKASGLAALKENEFDVEVMKAAALSTTSSSLMANQIFLTRNEVDKETYRDKKNPTVILDLIKVVPTNASTIYWRERVTTEGAPVTVAEAASFPREQLKWEEQSEKVKKIAVYSDFSEEMLEDTDFFESELPMELKEDVMLVLDDQVFIGDGTGTNLRGLKTVATTFAKPAGVGTLTGVTKLEVLRIVLLQLRKAGFIPNAIVLNPSDIALMELDKDSNGQYLLPPFVSADGTKIKGVNVIENNKMTEGDFFAGDFTKTKLKMKREVTFKMFEQDPQTAQTDTRIATLSLRCALVTPRPNRKAFVKGTFSTAITALQS